MKATIIFLLLSVSAFGQPNKAGIDSIVLKNDSLFSYSRGVKSFKGETSVKFNTNRSLGLGYNMNLSGVGSLGFGPNIILPGHNSVAIGQNNQVFSNGSSSFGADNISYSSANYSFVANDGNESYGTASSTFGFGNNNFQENGTVFGNSNTLGTTPNLNRSSFLGGERNKATGDRIFGFGRVINQSGNDNITFGTGVDGTLTPLLSSEPSSFNVGFNSTVPTFTIHKSTGLYGITEIRGPVKINGVLYNFPSSQGSPGSVLVNDGFGNLSWSASAAREAKTVAVFNSMGQLLYIKPIH